MTQRVRQQRHSFLYVEYVVSNKWRYEYCMLTEKLYIVYECGWLLPYLLTYTCGVTSLLRICRVSPCARACMRAWLMRACVRACMRACGRGSCVRGSCVRAWLMRACVRACVAHACVRACMRACVLACMLCAPCSVIRAPYVLRAPCSVLRAPCSVLRAPCSVLRSWELMGTCGNMWELMGTYGNL